MAITGAAAAIATGAGIVMGKKQKKVDEANEQAVQKSVEDARALATSTANVNNAADAAARARAARTAAAARAAAGVYGRSSSTLLTSPLGDLGATQRKTLLGT